MHFIHVRDGSPMGRVEGPIEADAVSLIERLATKNEIQADRRERLRGEPFPGSEPQTRDDYEYRLIRMAKALPPRRTSRVEWNCATSSTTWPTSSSWRRASAPGC